MPSSAKTINKKKIIPLKTSYNEATRTVTFSVLPLLTTTTTKTLRLTGYRLINRTYAVDTQSGHLKRNSKHQVVWLETTTMKKIRISSCRSVDCRLLVKCQRKGTPYACCTTIYTRATSKRARLSTAATTSEFFRVSNLFPVFHSSHMVLYK